MEWIIVMGPSELASAERHIENILICSSEMHTSARNKFEEALALYRHV
jgi:hypothetical protein